MNNKITENLIGVSYNRLRIISNPVSEFSAGKKRRYVLCECICGNRIKTMLSSVMSGHTKSCGCINLIFTDKEITKGTRSSYNAMIKRCYDPKYEFFHYYGGRGITVCDTWIEGFINFYNDMGSTWQPGLQIDRKDNDKGYSLDNCRWVTSTEQQRNKRNIKMTIEKVIEIRQSTLSLKELSHNYNVHANTIGKIKNNKRWVI